MFNRSLNRLMRALFEPRHWKTAFKIFWVCKTPIEYFRRYVFSVGMYPWSFEIRTPVGIYTLVLLRFEDIFTVNEIFLWEIYSVNKHSLVFLDIGGNVGLASLYFLTRSQNSRGVLVEPLEHNIVRARNQLSDFKDRVEFLN